MSAVNPIGIMQGRFTSKGGFLPQQFPWTAWEKEFEISRRADIQCVEWMFNYENSGENPLMTDSGRRKLSGIIRDTGVNVQSVCANYFMKRGCFRGADGMEVAKCLLFAMRMSQIHVLILPLFEDNEPQNETEYGLLKQALQKICIYANQCGVQIGIETNWNLAQINDLLGISDTLGVCYDLGNAAGLGKGIANEITSLKNRIVDVHIKDKPVGGSSVMLGEGAVDFDSSFKALDAAQYTGPYILETYYNTDAIKDTLQNIQYVKKQFMQKDRCQ